VSGDDEALSSLVNAGEEILKRVHEFRVAARTIVEAVHVDERRRELGLVDLHEMAHAEPDLTVRTWSERAIWQEAKGFLGMDDEQPALPPEGYERRQRRLRQEGLETCPACFARIATEEELRRWSELRRAEVERLERHERAVT
jgi:hypothetical protein